MSDAGGPPPHRLPGPVPPPPDRVAYDLQAGVVDVRPLGFTDLLDGAFTLYRTTLRTSALLVLAVMVPVQLASAYLQREALSFGLTGLLDDPSAGALLFGDSGGTPGLALTVATTLLITPLLAGSLVLVAGHAYLGAPIGAGAAAARTGRAAGWLVLAYLGSVVLRAAPLLLAVPVLLAAGEVAGALVALPLGLVSLLLSPLFVLLFPALLLEPRHPVDACRHAVTLARNGYGRTLLVVVGTGVVFNVVAVLLAGIPSVIGFIGGFGFAWVLVALGSTISQLVVAPLTASAMVLLHADLRMRQEGWDFDVLLERLRPRAPAAAGTGPVAGGRPAGGILG